MASLHLSGMKWAMAIFLLLPLAAFSAQPSLADARFQGLTRIEARSDVPLDGMTAADLALRRADGVTVAPTEILDVQANGRQLAITLSASVFAHASADGATLATRAFGRHAASRPVAVRKDGEPAAHGYLVGTSGWTDEGWNTVVTDPAFADERTGQRGLYRFDDTTPNRGPRGEAIVADGAILTHPAHRAKTMLVLFVEFPDRQASDAEAPYGQFGPYLNFLQPAETWFATSSYGRLQLKLASPQHSRKLDWLKVDKLAASYNWGDSEGMFVYCRDVAQLAYDRYGIRVDDYDLLAIVPARGKAGLPNGPANINDQYMGQSEQPPRTVYVDRAGRARTLDTFVTAGNDLFRWGYRWLIHETGHTFGLPDLYMYEPKVKGVAVDRYFYVGGWDIMGNIAGQSSDLLAWHKWKLRWIRDDQVDVISRAGSAASRHTISPVETPGGSKMVVVRTGLSTAYVAEFRTMLGVNAFDGRARHGGVLLYRVDAAQWENGAQPALQVISRQYYHSPEVGGERNLTGVWRPLDGGVDGYGEGATWHAGDVFADPATGVTIRIERVGQGADPRGHTAEDSATLVVEKRVDAPLARAARIADAALTGLTQLRFVLDVAPLAGQPNWFERQRSQPGAADLVLTAGGKPVPAASIKSVKVDDGTVLVEFKAGTFANAAAARSLRVATRPYFNVGAAPAAPVRLEQRAAAVGQRRKSQG